MRRLGAVLLLAVLASAPAVADSYLFGTSGFDLPFLNYLVINGNVQLTTDGSPFNPGGRSQGWWSATNANTSGNFNYIVGELNNDYMRDFFTFDLKTLNTPATSAELQIIRWYEAGSPPWFYELHNVSTDAATLNNTVGTSAAIYNDLGDGTLYGSVQVTDFGNPLAVLHIPLNSGALADINSIALAGQDPSAEHAFFSTGGALGSAPTAIPEPSTCLMLGTALAGLASLRRRWS